MILISLLFSLLALSQAERCVPYGLRLSLGTSFVDQTSNEKMTVRFNTKNPCNRSYVEISSNQGFSNRVLCQPTLVSFDSYRSYVQDCPLTQLSEGEEFTYAVFGWSGSPFDDKFGYKEAQVKSHMPKYDSSFKMVVLGDWGFLQKERNLYDPLDAKFKEILQSGERIDAILICGDVAYDLDSNNGTNYEYFIEMLSQVGSRWPIIFPPGNHERTTTVDRLVYSASFEPFDLDLKGVSVLHLPHFNLLLYDPYKLVYLNIPDAPLFQTFKTELKKLTGLTIVAAHYPYRCSGPAKDCIDKPARQMHFFEEMITNNVPLYLGSHYHAYERAYPTTSPNEFTYEKGPYYWSESGNHKQMVTVVNGIAGSDTFLDEAETLEPFTAAGSYLTTGFGIVEVSEHEIYFREVLSGRAAPVDEFHIYLNRNSNKQLRLRGL